MREVVREYKGSCRESVRKVVKSSMREVVGDQILKKKTTFLDVNIP